MVLNKNKLKNSLSHLPESVSAELKSAVDYILEASAIPIAMIWLIGGYARGDYVNGHKVHADGFVSKKKSDIDILLIAHGELSSNTNKSLSVLVDGLRARKKIDVNFRFIYENFLFFNNAVRNGENFCLNVIKEGIVLFDTEVTLGTQDKLNAETRRRLSIRYFEQFYANAIKCQETFEFHYKQKNYEVAIFSLHQMAETLFNTYLLVATQNKPRTHQLYVLRNASLNLNNQIRHIFPTHTESSNRLFTLFSSVYVNARSNNNFSINRRSLDQIAQWIERFQKWTHTECLTVIDRYAPNLNYSKSSRTKHAYLNMKRLNKQNTTKNLYSEHSQ